MAALTLHTEAAAAAVSAWGAHSFLLPDDVPEGAPLPARPGCRAVVLVAGSLDDREPVREAIAAAALAPEVEWRFTGEIRNLPPDLPPIPANAVFTGWLHYDAFLSEMAAASVVAAFSTDPGIMNRAAFEAVGLERPLVLSEFPGLRARFGEAALFCVNQPAAMAAAVRQAVASGTELEARSRRLKAALRDAHVQGLATLRDLIAVAAHA